MSKTLDAESAATFEVGSVRGGVVSVYLDKRMKDKVSALNDAFWHTSKNERVGFNFKKLALARL